MAIIIISITVNTLLAESPTVTYQEIRNDRNGWKDAIYLNPTKGNPITDILLVNYFSNGRFLNATIWLSNTIWQKYLSSYKSGLTYGVLIDADFNRKTGIDGADYNLAVDGENKRQSNGTYTRIWNETLEQWPSNLQYMPSVKRVVYTNNHPSGIYANGKNFINLSLDLSKIGFPKQYRIIFYSIEKKINAPWIMDFTKWINIPAPDISISTEPSSLDLIAGQNKTIEFQVKSSVGFKPEVYVSTKKLPGIDAKVTYNNLTVPTYGQATTPMWIKISPGVNPQPYILTILTNATVPSESIENIDKMSDKVKRIFFAIPPLEKTNIENITSVSSLVINVQPPLTVWQEIYNFIVAWQWLIAIGIGIVVDRFIPWKKIKKGLTKFKQKA